MLPCLHLGMRAFLALFLVGATTVLASEGQRFTSGAARVALVELYTSEGCSSCPPADHWLGEQRTSPGLWKEFVPVAFHVNYWDSLGWKDRLSSKVFTAREYAYASAWGSTNVYTPCFVRNGSEWRPSWGSPGPQMTSAGELTLETHSDGACTVIFSPATASATTSGYAVHVALLGGGIDSHVTAGENSGETLQHEFVVLGLSDRELTSPQGSSPLMAHLNLPETGVTGAKRRAVAAWVTRSGDLTPVQATGGWLP
jgi:hypothetical protein